jgi:death-on-curing protein
LNEPAFLSKEEIFDLHEEALRVAGGSSGFLNEGALDSALAAPLNRYHYEGVGLFVCAAT